MSDAKNKGYGNQRLDLVDDNLTRSRKVKQLRGMTFSAVLTADPEGGYVAFNPETGTTTQGETVDEAIENLREATELYLEEFPAKVAGKSLLTTFEIPTHA